MERIAILCPEVREHPALSPFFSIPEKANKRVKRVNSQALIIRAGVSASCPIISVSTKVLNRESTPVNAFLVLAWIERLERF